MRYAKLGLGVLLTIGGAIVTFGGVARAFFFFHHCVGVASGSLEAAYCHENHVAPVAVTWLVGGLAGCRRHRCDPVSRNALGGTPPPLARVGGGQGVVGFRRLSADITEPSPGDARARLPTWTVREFTGDP
jgi:hypothetical protein